MIENEYDYSHAYFQTYYVNHDDYWDRRRTHDHQVRVLHSHDVWGREWGNRFRSE